MTIGSDFKALTTHAPLAWQRRLYEGAFAKGDIPTAIDVPTGLGKTSVMALWLIGRAHGASLPRRLAYVVDRRAVVDQATDEAIKLREALEGEAKYLKTSLSLDGALPISTLRGQFVDNKEWLVDPAAPAIVVGTVDMIGSRLLFEGYGVSRRMRPYHAGFLGVDTLVVLDEAHLVPPFEHLLRAIETDAALRPKEAADLLPPFKLLPLSATQRGEAQAQQPPFRLEARDSDEITDRRLKASKTLRFEALEDKEHDTLLAKAAFDLARRNDENARVVIFCDRRAKKDDGAGPSAEGVAQALEDLAKADKKSGREKTGIDVELLVGARRVHERDQAKGRLEELGFVRTKKSPEEEKPKKPAFLIATAAGEVGVDIDADHMISDLVSWERMVQRLGRVNRRGDGVAEVVVFDTSALEKNEDRKMRLEKTRALLEQAENLGPGALRALQARVGAEQIEAASSPEPLRPALNRALVDAWSMTSLDEHTGRPKIAPWLRGWTEETPQTTLVWRKYLPVRLSEANHATAPSKKEIEDFFEAAPPHESEKLETETFRVVEWLEKRAEALIARSKSSDQDKQWSDGSIIGFMFSNGEGLEPLKLDLLRRERKGPAKDRFREALSGRTIFVDARIGGIENGLLKEAVDQPPDTADYDSNWSNEAGFRVRLESGDSPPMDEAATSAWRAETKFVVRHNSEGESLDRLVVEHLKADAKREDARAVSGKPQTLSEHQDWAKARARDIAERLHLSDDAARILALAALLHDEGKQASRWQRAFKVGCDAEKYGLAGPLAKTRGPIDQAMLDGYRHEFGSLPYVEASEEFRALPEEWRDLVLHLVAAHHGQARPVIETRSCDDAPPSALEDRARTAALRFARLQKRWGPWGLAWWEALLRAADQQASRALEEPPSKEDR